MAINHSKHIDFYISLSRLKFTMILHNDEFHSEFKINVICTNLIKNITVLYTIFYFV